MRIDTFLPGGLPGAAVYARLAESTGFETLWAGEMAHDPMIALATATESTADIGLGSAVVLAFARSPMVVASKRGRWQLQAVDDSRSGSARR